eukprot:1316264-Rhodomonas_salina.1
MSWGPRPGSAQASHRCASTPTAAQVGMQDNGPRHCVQITVLFTTPIWETAALKRHSARGKPSKSERVRSHITQLGSAPPVTAESAPPMQCLLSRNLEPRTRRRR